MRGLARREATLAGDGTIVAARGDFSLAPGETDEIAAKLTKEGLRSFRLDRVRGLIVTATASDGSPLLSEQIDPPAKH